MHEFLGLGADDKDYVWRVIRNLVKCFDSLSCRFELAVLFSHWNYSFLVNDDDTFATHLVPTFNHVELKLFKALLEFDDPLICSKACLLIGTDAHGVIGSLKVNKEFKAPPDGTVSLYVLVHLFHSLLLLLCHGDHHFAQVVRYLLHVKWVYDVHTVQLPGASRELRENNGRLRKLWLKSFGTYEFKRTECEAVSQWCVQQNVWKTPESQTLFLSQTLNFVNQAAFAEFVVNLINNFLDFALSFLNEHFDLAHLAFFLLSVSALVNASQRVSRTISASVSSLEIEEVNEVYRWNILD